MMNVRIDVDGILLPSGTDRYTADFKKKLIANTKKAMNTVGKDYKQKIQNDTRSRLNIKREAFIKSISYKVHSAISNKLPTIHYYSRVPWVGMHDKGGTITKKVVIPLTKRKLNKPYKTIKTLMRDLSSSGNLFFDRRGSITIIWAKNTQAFKSRLIPFRSLMKSKTGKAVKKDERVNIALYVNGPTLKKKIRITDLSIESVPKIVREIERLFTL